MRGKAIALVVVVLALLLLATPGLVAAKGGSPQLFSLTGTITKLDYEAEDAITVQVDGGNRFVHSSVGKEVEALVMDDTYYKIHTEDGPVVIEYGDLELGDYVLVQGTVIDELFFATRVIVDRPEE